MPRLAAALATTLAAFALAPGAWASPCSGFDVGTTGNGSDLARDGTARHFEPVPVSASEPSLTLYAHMSSGGPQRFVLGTVVSTDESDNEAGCSPRVSPDNGTATDSPTPFTLTFACTRPGVSHVLLTVHPEGSDPISLRWSKHHGNALDVGTSWEGEDVVSVGVARPSYAPDKPTAVRNAYIKSDTFYLRLDPDQLNVTKEEAFNAEHGHAISASCSPSTVCGPSVSGNATQTYMLKKGPVLALSLDYNCKAADGVATVSLDIQMNPFAPVSFSLLKYCQNMRGFFVSSEGASHDVVRFGDVQPSWVPPENQSLPVHRYSAAGDGPHGATLTFTLQATVQKVKFDKPVVDVKSPYSPGNPVCTVEPSGSAAKGGTLEKDSEAALSLDVDCGDNSGYVVVNVTIGLPPYRTVQWTFAKFHGTRPGFDVVATMPLPSGVPSHVIQNGASVSSWQPPDPSVAFGPASVHHTYMFQGHLPLELDNTITYTVAPSEDKGDCDPVSYGPVSHRGVVVGATALHFDVLFWCKSDRQTTPPTFTFTIDDGLYQSQRFAFQKEVVFANGLFVGSSPQSTDVFGDGYAVGAWQHEATKPEVVAADEKERTFYLYFHRTDPTEPNEYEYRSPTVVADTRRYCSPYVTGPAVGGGKLVPSETASFTVHYNCSHAHATTSMSVLVPLLADSSERSPVMFHYVKYTGVDIPPKPHTPGADAGDASITLEVSVPRAPGGHITALNVTYKRTSASGAPKVSLFKSTYTPDSKAKLTLSGLQNGEEYEMQVTALDEAGASPPSDPVRATPSLPWTLIGIGIAGGVLLIVVAAFFLVRSIRARRRAAEEEGMRAPLIGMASGQDEPYGATPSGDSEGLESGRGEGDGDWRESRAPQHRSGSGNASSDEDGGWGNDAGNAEGDEDGERDSIDELAL